MKRRAAGIVLVAFAAVALAACQRQAIDPPRVDIPHVLVIHPQRADMRRTITLPGDLVGYYQSALYSKVTGYLKEIYVDKGDSVKAGQVLAVIEVPELEQQLERARANLEIAQLTYQRLQKVWKTDSRLIALQDVDIAQSKYLEAKANVDQLLTLVGYTRIIAPFDGVITERFVDPGALIHAGGPESAVAPTQGSARAGGSAAPVVTMARLDKLRIYVYVPQAEVGYIHQGMPATVSVQGLNPGAFRGQVVRFAHSLDLATRTMLTEVDLENPQHTLYPGMYANVTLVLQDHPDTLRIPVTALGGDKSRKVFVVRDGELEPVRTTTGLSNGAYVEVTRGLTGRDLVVQTFSYALQQGEHVDCDSASPLSPSLASAG